MLRLAAHPKPAQALIMWAGQFHYGDAWAAYRGPSGDNSLHSHTTMQIVVASAGEAKLVSADGRDYSGCAMMVRPGERHRLLATPKVVIFFLEPQTVSAEFVGEACAPGDIVELPEPVRALLDIDGPLDRSLDRLIIEAGARRASDDRIEKALTFLAASPIAGSVGRAAGIAGISPARLRALSKAQLGVPLTTWLSWRRLEIAGHAMAAGASIAAAAADAGFADQAHLSREMRKVFGVTPGTAANVVRRGERNVQDD